MSLHQLETLLLYQYLDSMDNIYQANYAHLPNLLVWACNSQTKPTLYTVVAMNFNSRGVITVGKVSG